MEFLFLFLMIALMAIAAVNVSYALIMVVVMLLRAVMKLLVVPLLQMTGKLLSLPFHALGWLLRGGQAVDPFAPPISSSASSLLAWSSASTCKLSGTVASAKRFSSGKGRVGSKSSFMAKTCTACEQLAM